MNSELIANIFEVCIIPLLGILTKYIVDLLKAKRIKTDNEVAQKYADMIQETITKCVIATNQTYVNSLKNTGSFKEEAQKEAFQKTYEAVLAILSDDAKDYMQKATGDMSAYLTAQIEAAVHQSKGSE